MKWCSSLDLLMADLWSFRSQIISAPQKELPSLYMSALHSGPHRCLLHCPVLCYLDICHFLYQIHLYICLYVYWPVSLNRMQGWGVCLLFTLCPQCLDQWRPQGRCPVNVDLMRAWRNEHMVATKCPRDSDSEHHLGGLQEVRISQSSSCDSDMEPVFRKITL